MREVVGVVGVAADAADVRVVAEVAVGLDFVDRVLARPQIVEVVSAVGVGGRRGDHGAAGIEQLNRHAGKHVLRIVEIALAAPWACT